MFDFIRTHQRLMQLILLILVVPSFVFLGISGYSFVTADTAMAVVDQEQIGKESFTQAQRNQLQQMQESTQGRFDPDTLDNPQARAALLDQMINQQIKIAIASKNHFSVSDAALRRAIATMPQWQEDGRFAPDLYNQVLAQYGISPRDFEASQRAELSLATVLDPIAGSTVLPKPVLDAIKLALTEQRKVGLKIFDAASYLDQVNISADDIQAWYAGHSSELMLPEQVTATYLVLDEAAALASVPAPEESQLQEYYEQNKSTYVLPARVKVSHILIKLPADASAQAQNESLQTATRLAEQAAENPQDFATLARSQSQDAGSARDGGALGWIQHGSLPAELEQAVFELQAGEISRPVLGSDGYHIFKADEVQAQRGETFDQARDKIEQEVRQQLAAERFADMATRLTGLVYDDSSSLEPAAKELGLQTRQASGIARERLLSEAEAGPQAAVASPDAAILDDVRVRQALFSPQVYGEKQNSGVIEISPDTMVVVRVDEILPAQVPALDKVAGLIRNKLEQAQALEMAQKQGELELAKLRQNDSKTVGSASPVEDGSEFNDAIMVSRLDPHGLSKQAVDAIFAINEQQDLPAYGSVTLDQAFVLIRLDEVKSGDANAPALAGLDMQLAQVWGAQEVDAVLHNLRQQLKVQVTDDGKQIIAEGV